MIKMEELETLSCGGQVRRNQDGSVSYRLFDPNKFSLDEIAKLNDVSYSEAADTIRTLGYFFSFANWKEVFRDIAPYNIKKVYLPKEFYKE